MDREQLKTRLNNITTMFNLLVPGNHVEYKIDDMVFGVNHIMFVYNGVFNYLIPVDMHSPEFSDEYFLKELAFRFIDYRISEAFKSVKERK